MSGYRVFIDELSGRNTGIRRLSDMAFIPIDTANTDYQQFKVDVLAGAELQDADGVPMTQAEADAYIATLP